MAIFWCGIATTLAVAALGETNILPEGIWQGEEQLEFVVLMVMELATVALIPLALRLFKFKTVKSNLREYGPQALMKWGVVRIDMLHFPMLLNALFYYFFANNSFGIMALILCLCLVFVYPSRKRCEAELDV